MKGLTKSWKTTIGAVLTALGLILVQFDVVTEDQVQEVVGALTAILGVLITGFAARDNGVTSSRAGAK